MVLRSLVHKLVGFLMSLVHTLVPIIYIIIYYIYNMYIIYIYKSNSALTLALRILESFSATIILLLLMLCIIRLQTSQALIA